MIEFKCNLCDTLNTQSESFSREGNQCSSCNSNSRLRYAAYIVQCLLEESVGKIGLGLSENPSLAGYLKSRSVYINSFYHLPENDPLHFDLLNLKDKDIGTYDYMTSLDVFEHIPPPAKNAFIGAFNTLKPGGYLILSVPYTLGLETIEHFPNLYQFSLVRSFKEDQYILKNTTKAGEHEEFEDLIFHGGPGQTLEMRVFCEDHIQRLLTESGFTEVKFWSENFPEIGASFPEEWSRLISAKKPMLT